MKNIFKDWEQKMSAFESSAKKEIEEIKKYKAEMQKMRNQMSDLLQSGRYVRDNKRLILSAPEIIIGNVDPFGVLYSDANSKITLRGTNVGLQAAGDIGQVVVRAASIRELAEDPGIDGREHVLSGTSEIVNQARKIQIQSNNDKEAFSVPAIPEEDFGVSIVSDSKLKVGALSSSLKKRTIIDKKIKELNALKDELTASLESDKELSKNLVFEIDTLMEEKEKLTKDNNDVRSNYKKLEWLNMELETASHNIVNNIIRRREDTLSDLLETDRLLKAYYTQLDSITSGVDFFKKSTNTSLTIASEKINIASIDGDENIRDNRGAGIDMFANNFRINATEADGKLKEKGKVAIMAKNIEMVSGVNDAEYDEEGMLTAGTHIADGNVRIQSENITLESVDYRTEDRIYKEMWLNRNGKIKLRSKTIEVSTEDTQSMEVDEDGLITKAAYRAKGDVIVRSKTLTVDGADSVVENGEIKNKSLAGDSQVAFYAEKMNLSAIDYDGKAYGSISFNAKDVAIKSMDLKEDDHTDDKIASDGSITFVANKINMKTDEKIQLDGKQIGLFSDEILEAQQGNGRSAIQLSNGSVAVSANMTQVYGAEEVRGELKAPNANIDNLNVKKSFKSKNISDGVAVPESSAENLNTKLKKEEFDEIKTLLRKMRTENIADNPDNFDTYINSVANKD